MNTEYRKLNTEQRALEKKERHLQAPLLSFKTEMQPVNYLLAGCGAAAVLTSQNILL